MLHCGEYLRARQLLPGGGDQSCLGVVLAHERHGIFELLLAGDIGVGEDYAVGRLYLIVEEFSEVLHIHLALRGVDNGRVCVYHAIFEIRAVDGADDVGELAHARGFDEDPVGMVLFAHLL